MQKEEAIIRDFVFESAPNMTTKEKNEVVRNVIKGCDVPTKTIAWRDNECKDWLDTNVSMMLRLTTLSPITTSKIVCML